MGHADAAPAQPAMVTVTVAFSPSAGVVDEVSVTLPLGATLDDAVAGSGLAQRHAGIDALPRGVWGVLCNGATVLRPNDRVELYRGLQVDPKEARRRRQRAQAGPVKRQA